MPQLLEPSDNERLVQLEGNFLRQSALVQLQLRSHGDHRAGAVVDTLAEQVLAEPTLLPLDHVGERFQRSVVRPQHGTPTAAIVHQRVHGVLQHPLFIADNHLGGVEIEQLLQPVVPVDETSIKVIEIGGREVAALQKHERPEIRGDHRHDVLHHPLGLVARVENGLDDLQATDELLRLLLAPSRLELGLELFDQLLQVDLADELAHRLGSGVRLERITVLFPAHAELFLGQQLLLLQLRVTGIDHDVILVVDHSLEVRRFHGEEVSQPRRHRLEEPDVHDGRGQVDVAHPLTAHSGMRDLDSAAIADDAAVLDPLVLAAEALPVPLRSEDPLAEQTVLLGTVGAVVDGLRLLNLSVRPRENVVRGSQPDVNRTVVVDAFVSRVNHVKLLFRSDLK